MFGLDFLEGFDQSFNGSPVKHEADIFQSEFINDLLDDTLSVPLHSEPMNSHL